MREEAKNAIFWFAVVVGVGFLAEVGKWSFHCLKWRKRQLKAWLWRDIQRLKKRVREIERKAGRGKR